MSLLMKSGQRKDLHDAVQNKNTGLPHKVELLSPVGSPEALVAAVSAGADAVYLGSKLFNARRLANNFTADELKRAVQYAHSRGVKVFLTLNTLVKNQEVGPFLNQLAQAAQFNVDAVILQDLSFAPIVKEYFPTLEVHASTQSTIMNSASIEYWKRYVDVFVLARELTKEEIMVLKRNTGVRLETFVHGHLCISYSGQCLISSLIGKRSGNRGMCASSCRKQYNGDSYLLSARDLNLLGQIKEVVESGVSTIKIEGRMKPAEYTAITTKAYRKALDAVLAGRELAVTPQDVASLKMAFNREFTTGYFSGETKMVDPLMGTRRGVPLGIVRQGVLVLEHELEVNDGVGFVCYGEMSGGYVQTILRDGEPVLKGARGDRVVLELDGFQNGANVFLTTKRFGEEIFNLPSRVEFSLRVVVKEGLPTMVEMDVDLASVPSTYRGVVDRSSRLIVTLPTIAQKAVKHPFTSSQIDVEMSKFSSQYCVMSSIVVETDESFIPKSDLTTLRSEIEGRIFDTYFPTLAVKNVVPVGVVDKIISAKQQRMVRGDIPRLQVQVYSATDATSAVKAGAQVVYSSVFDSEVHAICSSVRSAHGIFGLHTPMVLRDADVIRVVERIKEFRPEFVIVNNVGMLHVLQSLSYSKKDKAPTIILGYQLNVFNDVQLAQYGEFSIASIELNLDELKAFKLKERLLYYVHGAPVVMTFNEEFEDSSLTDNMNYTFPLRPNGTSIEMLYSRTIGTLQHTREVLNAGVSMLFVDLTQTSEQGNGGGDGKGYGRRDEYEAERVVRYYADVLHGKRVASTLLMKGVTLGNLRKGVM